MAPSNGYKYPLPGNSFALGKLPPVRQKNMDRPLCVGRVWIFLILGTILIVLGLVSIGVYFNMDTITSSRKYMEVMPPLVNSGGILLSGLCVCLLFWKRLKPLVLLAVVVCIASGLLCGTTAVLNTTHILKPIQSFTNCRYYLSQKLCMCYSPYNRDMLSLDYTENDLTKYEFEDAGSCTSIQEVLPQLLYTVIAVYSIVLLVCIGSSIVALLVLRIETHKRSCFQDENYEEVYTVSGSSSHDQSDSEVEVITTNREHAQVSQGSSTTGKPPSQRGSVSDTLNSNRSGIPSVNSNRSGNQSQTIGRSTASSQTSLQQQGTIPKTLAVQRSKTPALDDIGKESLANRYKINKTPEREVTYRHRLSKTPDREFESRRRNSVNLSKRLSKSCDSLESSGRESPDKQEFWDTGPNGGKGKGRLKAHRRKGKRAATVSTLDRDQLLLILSLQMRYMQETQEKDLQQRHTQGKVATSSRRAITPQPSSSQQPVIPQKIRSHTPQPYKSRDNQVKDPKEKEFYDQIEMLLFRSKQKEQQRLAQHKSEAGWGKRTRNLSDSSNANTNFNDRLNDDQNCVTPNERQRIKEDLVRTREKVNRDYESYLTSQQIYNSTPTGRSGYIPYSGKGYNSAESVHYITYSDNMLSKQQRKPKSRPSVQSSMLPPEPLHRGTRNQLPPQPISRQQQQQHITKQPLPPQPIHRGQSAFQVVDRSSKSRSPSVVSDRNEHNTVMLKASGANDRADVAIRENFQMNPSPYMLQNSQDSLRNPLRNGSANQNTPLVGRRGPTPPTEVLPPYSGPPSYYEYVSSCEHSVTSSLSSNPDDIYSMPKRRVQHDEEPTNQSRGERVSTNQNAILCDQISRNTVEHIYGNAETYQQNPNQFEGRGQRTGNPNEGCYNSPSRSRVKQFIVPEDYYTPIHKIQRQKEKSKLQNPKANMIPSNEGFGRDFHYGNMQNFTGRSIHAYHPTSEHQIAPDAKYHEYEDVYDTVSPQGLQQSQNSNAGRSFHQQSNIAPTKPLQRTEGPSTFAHPLNTHGFESPNSRRKPKRKSKDKTPSKSTPFNPVSNVNARVLDSSEVNGRDLNDHVTGSVQNVHARNVRDIPKIKLNNNDTDGEDDVFTDSDVYTTNYGLLKGQDNHRSEQDHQVIHSEFGNTHNSQEYHETPARSWTNENTKEVDHLVHVTDTGYMKMTLPVSEPLDNVTVNPQNDTVELATGSDNSGAGHITGSYEVGHVTEELTNQNTEFNNDERELPDGVEAVCESRSTSDFEETGV